MELLSRAALNLAAFMIVGSLFMLAATEPGTPERVITVITLVAGLTVSLAAAIALLHQRRNKPHEKEQREDQ